MIRGGGGAYARKDLYEGGLIRGVTQVSRKRWAYLWRGLYAEGGLYAEKYGIRSKFVNRDSGGAVLATGTPV